MQSFRSNIVRQIEKIPEGKIFTFKDIVFPLEKTANVAVVLSELTKEAKLLRIDKGAYYKPQKSTLGLGLLPVFQEEQIKYLIQKMNGYLTGASIYNKMSLTEQVSPIITIASSHPVRPFKFNKLSVECVKAYINDIPDDETLRLVRILDAIKDIKHIPAVTPKVAYERIFSLHLSRLSNEELYKIVYLSMSYPPRVRIILGDMMTQDNHADLKKRLNATVSPTTKFDISYKTG